MHKSSIYLAPELDLALANAAARMRITKAEFIRQALADAVRDDQPRFTAIGVFNGPGDLASEDERYLAETGFGEDR